MPITANLTVFREADGTLHIPDGSVLPIDLDCQIAITDVRKAALLTVILLNVDGAITQITVWQTGAYVATKITNVCTGSYVFVKEPYNDVRGLQYPCCWRVDNSDGGWITEDDAPITNEDGNQIENG